MLPSFNTLQAQIAAGDLSAVLVELNNCEADPIEAQAVGALHDVLRAAAHVVSADPMQLAGQILARLRPDDNPYLARLLMDAQGWRDAPWLRPLKATLASPGMPLVRTISGQRYAAYSSVAITAGGRYALAGTRQAAVDYWDVVDGCRLATLSGHTQSIMGIGLTDDGLVATSFGLDGTLRVWDPQTGTSVVTIRSHTSTVGTGCHALSPDGRSALVAADDGVLTLYATSNGAIIRRFEGHPDIADFANYLQGWHNRSPDHPVASPPSYTALVFTRDCQQVVSATTAGIVCVWDVASGAIVRRWQGVSMTISIVLPDTRHAVCATREGVLVLYDIHAGALLMTIQAHRGWMYHVACSGNGRTLATCAEDSRLCLWRFDGDRLHPQGVLTNEPTYATALDAHSQRMVSVTGEGQLRVWDLTRIPPDGAVVASEPLQTAIAGGSWICTVTTASPDRMLMSNTVTGDRFIELGRHRAPIQALARSVDGQWLGAGDEHGIISMWTPADARSYGTIRTNEPVYGMAISVDGQTLLSWTEGTTLSVWDIQRKKRRHAIENYNDQIDSADVSPDGQVIAAIIDGYLLEVWDQQGQTERHTVEHYDDYMSFVRIHTDGRTILTGTNEGKLLVWDMDRGNLLQTLTGHDRAITDIACSAEGSRAISTSSDGTVCLWNVQDGICIARFAADNPLLSGAMTENGNGYTVVDASGQAHWLRLEGM